MNRYSLFHIPPPFFSVDIQWKMVGIYETGCTINDITCSLIKGFMWLPKLFTWCLILITSKLKYDCRIKHVYNFTCGSLIVYKCSISLCTAQIYKCTLMYCTRVQLHWCTLLYFTLVYCEVYKFRSTLVFCTSVQLFWCFVQTTRFQLHWCTVKVNNYTGIMYSYTGVSLKESSSSSTVLGVSGKSFLCL